MQMSVKISQKIILIMKILKSNLGKFYLTLEHKRNTK